MAILPGEMFGSYEFYLEVKKGNVPGHSIVHKFGAGTLSTTLAAITSQNAYQTPTAAVALEFVSDSATDTAAGIGAREITVTGIDASWNEITQVIATNGATAVAIPTSLLRLTRWFVSASGTYADSSAGSHTGELTIQVSGGGTVWDTISASVFPLSQSEIGAYTIPTGFTGYLITKSIQVNSNKSTDIYFFKREGADTVVAPYSPMRVVEHENGLTKDFQSGFISPKAGFAGACDLGFMGKIDSGTAETTVEFEILLVEDGF